MTFHNKAVLPKHHGTLKAFLLLKVCLKKWKIKKCFAAYYTDLWWQHYKAMVIQKEVSLEIRKTIHGKHTSNASFSSSPKRILPWTSSKNKSNVM